MTSTMLCKYAIQCIAHDRKFSVNIPIKLFNPSSLPLVHGLDTMPLIPMYVKFMRQRREYERFEDTDIFIDIVMHGLD